MPCAACYNRHKVVLHEARKHPEEKKALDKAVEYTYQDKVHVSTLVEVFHRQVGLKKIADSVREPLQGLKVVTYYGCLMTRPSAVTGAAHPENPVDMDELLAALGAEVRDWSYKTVCCGAAHSLTRPDIVLKMSSGLISHAREAGADMIAVACPLCHTNLDARQFQMKLDQPLPVLYFTQLMAVAFGLPGKAAALHKNLVDPRKVFEEKKIVYRN